MIFSAATAALALGAALLLAVMADRVIRGAVGYKTLLMAPYAIAPVVAGVLWLFMFNPTVGIIAYILRGLGYTWNHHLNGTKRSCWWCWRRPGSRSATTSSSSWPGLQAIPKAVIEAAAIDGAGPGRRFWRIVFPLLSPTTFFLVVVNLVYAFFDTFGIIHAVTGGGPAKATETLVYKVFNDGFIGLDFGGSAAQSVILMAIVIGLTVVQFRYIERRVVY